MRDDDDGVVGRQLPHQVLDLEGGDGIEGGAGLVHEDDIGVVGEGAGDAEALLLAAGEGEAGLLQVVLHLVPEGGALEGALDQVVEVAAEAVHLGAEGDVFVDRLGERVGLLEDHADAAADLDGVDVGAVDVGVAVADAALDGDAGDEVVHAVEAADEGALAAAGGADEGRDLLAGDVEPDAGEGLLPAVPEAQVGDGEGELTLGFRDVLRGFVLGRGLAPQGLAGLLVGGGGCANAYRHLGFTSYYGQLRLRRSRTTSARALSPMTAIMRTMIPAAAFARNSGCGRIVQL